MFEKVVFDIETNGLDDVSKVHCIAIRDIDTGTCISFGPEAIDRGLRELSKANLIVGHNIIAYDLPVLYKLHGYAHGTQQVFDTLVASRVVWPRDKLMESDLKRFPTAKIIADWEKSLAYHQEFDPRSTGDTVAELTSRIKIGKAQSKLIGSHSLKAWGYRLDNAKGEYAEQSGATAWDTWSPQMQSYCEQDTDVTLSLYNRIAKENWSQPCLDLEHAVAFIIQRQRARGFLFNKEKAVALYAKLSKRREQLRNELQEIFPPWEVVEKTYVAKVGNKSKGISKGDLVTKKKMITFNPGSRHHVANRLIAKGWKPELISKQTGVAQIDEAILESLPYPEAKHLAEFFMLEKRIGQLAEGEQAWLKHIWSDGRIHGSVNTNGAVTGRMTHNAPNIAQTPASRSPYGDDCRELFCSPKGFKLVGSDADALELRCLAGYMSQWDGGAYIRTVEEGRKADGTDIHSVNCRALGFDPATHRDMAKTWFYAFIYGAWDTKLGEVLGATGTKAQITAAGRASRDKFLANLPALGKLTEMVQRTFRSRGYLIGLDGRKLFPRNDRSALNTLLQSAGAVLMKMVLTIADDKLQHVPFEWYWVANIHDELQSEVEEAFVTVMEEIQVASYREAGEFYKFPCPIKGNAVHGETWKDTH